MAFSLILILRREIGEAIESILSNPEVHHSLSLAAERAKPNLDWIVHAKRYYQVAQEAVAPPLSRPPFLPLKDGLICSDIDNTLTGDIAALKSLTRWLKLNPSLPLYHLNWPRFGRRASGFGEVGDSPS